MSCAKSKENISSLIEVDKSWSKIYKSYLFGLIKIHNDQLSEQLLKDGYDLHTFVTEKAIDAATVKLYGKNADRMKLVAKIEGIMDANPNLAQMIYEFALVRIPKNVKMGEETVGREIPDLDEEGNLRLNINLERYPINTLRLIYNKSQALLKQTTGSKFFKTKFGGHFAHFKTSQKLKWEDPTGAYDSIARGVRDHASKISSRINLFTSNPRFISEDKKLIGMEKILTDIKELSKLSPENTESQFVELFSMTMKNWVYLDDNGVFWIHQDHAPRRYDENHPHVKSGEKKVGQVMKYESTGDTMYSFQNPMQLKTYTPLNQEKGSLYIDMTPMQIKKFRKAMKDARAITDAVFDYSVNEFSNSTESLMQGLRDYYDGKLNDFAIKQIFFFGETTYKDKATGKDIDLLEPLTQEERKEIDLIKDTFSMTVNDSMVIANGGVYNPDEKEYRQNYWPTMYNVDVLKPMLTKMRETWTDLLDKTNDLYERKKDAMTVNDRVRIYKAIEILESKLNSVNSILDNMDGYHVDAHHMSLMHFAKDNKHFKRISNAYDLRSSRLDDGLFYDYLKHIMGGIEKNNLAGDLLETLRRIKEDRLSKNPKWSKGEGDSIIAAAINLHRNTYHSVQTMGMFGSIEGWTNKINGVTGVFGTTTTPEMVSRYLRTFTSSLSGLFLQNATSAITNFGGAYENIINEGIKSTLNGFKLYYNSNKKMQKGMETIIQQSAITEFSDFFSKAMVNGIIQTQLEEQVSEAIMREMILYYNRIGKSYTDEKGVRRKWTKSTSRDEFNRSIVKYLSKSKLWMKSEDLVIRSRERVKQSIKETRSRMRLTAANKLVQWAINKQYEMKPLVNQGLFKQWARLPFGTGMGILSQMWQTPAGRLLTMGNTETTIRSVSFIIGAENAWKSGMIRNDIHWSEYTNPVDINSVIKIGREYSYFMNFGMSTQDVSSFNYGPGQMMGKFKYWSQQKAEADIGKFSDAILSLTDKPNVKGLWPNIKTIVKMLGLINMPGLQNRKNRIARPEIAAMRTFWLTQGLSEVMWNLFMFNPLNLKNISKQAHQAHQAYKWLMWGDARQLKTVMSSDVMAFLTLPLAMGIKAIIQGFSSPEDEEDLERSISYWLRRVPFAGFMITWSMDAIWAVIAQLANNKEMWTKKQQRLWSIGYGRPEIIPVFKPLQRSIDWASSHIADFLWELQD